MIVLEENIEVSDAIRHKAAELAQRVYPDECNVWDRGNWEAQNIRVAFECGAVEQRNVDIEKACKWINAMMVHYGIYDAMDREDNLKNFRKAMMEE